MAKKRSKRASKTPAVRRKRRGKTRAAPTERRTQPKEVINAWEDDPGAGAQPSGGQVIQRPIPVLRDRPLPIRTVHPARAPQENRKVRFRPLGSPGADAQPGLSPRGPPLRGRQKAKSQAPRLTSLNTAIVPGVIII
jgi:hypothetical protein